MTPQEMIQKVETTAVLPAGVPDRFFGYSIMGMPFRSGHVLALRRFPASSVGPGYTSVWHRDPAGNWTFYSTVAPELSCSKYFGVAIARNIVTKITIRWLSAHRFCVIVSGSRGLYWEVALTETWMSRMMNGAGRLVPDLWWHKPLVLRGVAAASRLALGTGKIRLTGRTPNGHEFVANPQQMWPIVSSGAIIGGEGIGPLGPLTEQARLGDLWIPQRGVFAVGRVYVENKGEIAVLEKLPTVEMASC